MGVKQALREFNNRSQFPESDVEQQQEIDFKGSRWHGWHMGGEWALRELKTGERSQKSDAEQQDNTAGNRTQDLPLSRWVLYQLSYCGLVSSLLTSLFLCWSQIRHSSPLNTDFVGSLFSRPFHANHRSDIVVCSTAYYFSSCL